MTAKILLVVSSCVLAQAPAPKWAEHSRVSGTVMTLTPDPYTELKSFTLKLATKDRNKDQMSFAVSAGVKVPAGLKAGDILSVQYRVDSSGVFWVDSVKKVGTGKPPTPDTAHP